MYASFVPDGRGDHVEKNPEARRVRGVIMKVISDVSQVDSHPCHFSEHSIVLRKRHVGIRVP